MIWKDDANTSYRKGEKIRIDLYAKSTDGGADRLVKSQEVTPTENESFQNFTFDNLQIAENGVYIEYYAKEIFEDVDLILRVKITEPWTAASFGTAVKHSPIF